MKAVEFLDHIHFDNDDFDDNAVDDTAGYIVLLHFKLKRSFLFIQIQSHLFIIVHIFLLFYIEQVPIIFQKNLICFLKRNKQETEIRHQTVEICAMCARRSSLFLYTITIRLKICKALLLTTRYEVTYVFPTNLQQYNDVEFSLISEILKKGKYPTLKKILF